MKHLHEFLPEPFDSFLNEELNDEDFQIFETVDGDKIMVPKFTPKNTDHRIYKKWPVEDEFYYDDRFIKDAIKWGMILEMTYINKDGVETKRQIQPMVLGKSIDKNKLLRAFHLEGESESLGKNTKKIWRLFSTDNIDGLRFTGSFFRTASKNYNPSDSAMKGGIIIAADINTIQAKQESLFKNKKK